MTFRVRYSHEMFAFPSRCHHDSRINIYSYAALLLLSFAKVRKCVTPRTCLTGRPARGYFLSPPCHPTAQNHAAVLVGAASPDLDGHWTSIVSSLSDTIPRTGSLFFCMVGPPFFFFFWCLVEPAGGRMNASEGGRCRFLWPPTAAC